MPVPAVSAADAFLPPGPPPAWLTEALERLSGPARGLDPATVPAVYRLPLSHAGVPLADGANELRWGIDLAAGDGDGFAARDGCLVLPAPAVLATLGSLALKPLRVAVAARTGVRLKIGAGVHLRLWGHGALLVSGVAATLGGFISGPRPGQRTGLLLEAGEHQLVTW